MRVFTGSQQAGYTAGYLAVLGVAMGLQAQTTNTVMETGVRGLPEYGISLTGSPGQPEVHNAGGRGIIAYCLRFESRQADTGQVVVQYALRTSLLRMRGPVSKGGAVRDTALVPAGGSALFMPSAAERGPMLRVALDAVMYGDGEIVGPDTGHTYEMITVKIQAERDLHAAYLGGRVRDLVRDGVVVVDGADQRNALEGLRAGQGKAPDQLTGRARQVYLMHQRVFARELLSISSVQGESGAREMARHSVTAYPLPWRKEAGK